MGWDVTRVTRRQEHSQKHSLGQSQGQTTHRHEHSQGQGQGGDSGRKEHSGWGRVECSTSSSTKY